jgi:hypothetical protein
MAQNCGVLAIAEILLCCNSLPNRRKTLKVSQGDFLHPERRMRIDVNEAENLGGEAQDAALLLPVCRKRTQPFEAFCGEVYRLPPF